MSGRPQHTYVRTDGSRGIGGIGAIFDKRQAAHTPMEVGGSGGAARTRHTDGSRGCLVVVVVQSSVSGSKRTACIHTRRTRDAGEARATNGRCVQVEKNDVGRRVSVVGDGMDWWWW